MIRGFSLLFAIAVVLRADALEDAARALAKRVSTHISARDSVRVAERNISSLPAAEAARARQAVERAMRRGTRNGTAVNVLLTLSENPHDTILVAEIVRGEERWLEVVTYRTIAISPSRNLPALERRLVWEQTQQLLDVRELEGLLVVLDANELAVYEGRRRIRGWPLPALSRDPVARLNVEGDRVTIHAPERECAGTWRPEIKLECTVSGEPGNLWRLPSTPPHYSAARIGDNLTVLAEPDGRVHLYDSSSKVLGSWSGWGADLAAICPGKILASSDRDRERGDVLQLFNIVEGKPVAASEPLEVQGPVVAISSADAGAIAIVRGLSGNPYAAYHITVDCTR